MDGRKLLEALIDDATKKRNSRAKHCPSRQTLEKIASLSIRGFERFLERAERSIKIRYEPQSITVQIDTEALEKVFDGSAEDFLVLDDIDKLVMFGAPRSVIHEVTGAHHMVVAGRRKTFGVESKSGKPRELSETEYAAICKVWRELSFLETTDRLIMVSRITGLSIGTAWPVLKEQDLIKPVSGETGKDGYTNDNDRLSDPNGQYG